MKTFLRILAGMVSQSSLTVAEEDPQTLLRFSYRQAGVFLVGSSARGRWSEAGNHLLVDPRTRTIDVHLHL